MTPPAPLRRLLLVVALPLELALLAGAVAVLPLAAVAAVADRRRRLLRLDAFTVAFVVLELAALARFAALWAQWPVRGSRWYDGANRRCTAWVLGAVLGAARRCLGFRIELDDRPPPGPMAAAAPVLVLARHGGAGDSFALVWLLLTRYGRRPRVVLKRMLLWEPLLDVALSRLGACFLAAGAPDRARQVATVAADLGPHDALLVFPEGANWTPERRRRAIARLRAARKGHAAAAADLMEHVLPPRPAGVLECLAARPELPVVVVAHTGLDTITSLGEAWRAIPFAAAMTAQCWAPPPPPHHDDARMRWLTHEWAIVDEWIDAHRPRVDLRGPRATAQLLGAGGESATATGTPARAHGHGAARR